MQSYLTLEHLWKIYELDETWDKVMLEDLTAIAPQKRRAERTEEHFGTEENVWDK